MICDIADHDQELSTVDVLSLDSAAHKPGARSDTATNGEQKEATPSPVTSMDGSFVFEHVMDSFRHSVQEDPWPRYGHLPCCTTHIQMRSGLALEPGHSCLCCVARAVAHVRVLEGYMASRKWRSPS